MEGNALFKKYGDSFKPNHEIFREGEAGDKMYIIQSGKVRISKKIAGHDHILALLGKGEFFGEMAIFSQMNRTATATAVDDVQVLVFNRSGFEGMVEKNPKLALNIIDKLCRRLQNANVHIQHLVKKNENEQIARTLLYRFLEKPGDYPELIKQRTIEEIALELQIPQTKLEMFLELLENKGLIVSHEARIRLVNKEKLANISGETLHGV